MHIGPSARRHAARERLDVVAPEAPRLLVLGAVRVRCHIPHRAEGDLVDVAHLGQAEQSVVASVPVM